MSLGRKVKFPEIEASAKGKGFDTSIFNAEDIAFLNEKLTSDVNDLTSQATGKILLQSVPQIDVSSTQIRQKLLNDEDVSEYMPAAVNQQLRGFINDNR